MTTTDAALHDQKRMRTFSYLLATGLVAATCTPEASSPPSDHALISYERSQYTASSYGTLEVKETFISKDNVLNALIALHEDLLHNQVQLEDDLSSLLYTNMEDLYA